MTSPHRAKTVEAKTREREGRNELFSSDSPPVLEKIPTATRTSPWARSEGPVISARGMMGGKAKEREKERETGTRNHDRHHHLPSVSFSIRNEISFGSKEPLYICPCLSGCRGGMSKETCLYGAVYTCTDVIMRMYPFATNCRESLDHQEKAGFFPSFLLLVVE